MAWPSSPRTTIKTDDEHVEHQPFVLPATPRDLVRVPAIARCFCLEASVQRARLGPNRQRWVSRLEQPVSQIQRLPGGHFTLQLNSADEYSEKLEYLDSISEFGS